MYTAIYYPHTTVRSQGILKTALLLWDQLEYISPFRGFRPEADERSIAEALELISKPHLPSDEEKLIAHKRIIELANSDLPPWFFFNPRDQDLPYLIYPQKFLPETWELLRQSKLAAPFTVGEYSDPVLTNSGGLTIMSILAESCAGKQKVTVTDKVDSYAALTRYLTQTQGGEYGNLNEDYERLVTISLKSIDTSKISLDTLIKLRVREIKKGDGLLRELRQNYRNAIEKYIESLRREVSTQSDIKEIERVFEQDISDDIKRLKKELKGEIRNLLLSKELVVAIVAAAGVMVEPISSSLISSGALIKRGIDYRKKREEILRKHPSSWPYISENERQLL